MPPDLRDRFETALAELECAEEELQVCLEELNSARQDTPGAGDGLRLLAQAFGALPVAAFLMNADGSIQWVNRAASALLGFSEDYLSHRPLAGLVDLDRRAAYRTHLSRLLQEGGTTTVPVRVGGCHGPSREVTLAMRRLETPGGARLVVATAHPGPGDTDGHLVDELANARAQVAHLRTALESRTRIGQATGLVMARHGVGAEEAFALLTRMSQNDNVKLARLAEIVLDEPAVIERR
jgi:phosphoserine phosphatase RsbU/P